MAIPSRSRRIRFLTASLAVVLLLSGAALAGVRGSAWLHHVQARRAWEVRRGDQVLAHAAAARSWGDRSRDLALLEARGLFLQGDALGALDSLLALSAGDDRRDLERQAGDALLAGLPWPERLVSARRLDLRAEERDDLVRVADGGPGTEGRLEAFGVSGGRYRALPFQVADPSGKDLRPDRPLRLPLGLVERVAVAGVTGRPGLLVWHRRGGRPVLDLLVGRGGGLTVFRFDEGAAVRLEGRDLVRPGARWHWRDGRFERD